MRLPRFTLWQMMLEIALIAVNLAAFLFVARPYHENRDLLYLTLGTVPNLDALAITGWLVVTTRRQFLVGFLYWGSAAVATHIYLALIRTIVLLAVLAVVVDLGPRRSADVARVASAGVVTLLVLHVWWHHRRSRV